MWSWGTTTPWGGVDLLNQNTKNYCIAFRNKKWYWPLYTWFLDVQLVQAWRLFRKTMKERHTKLREREAEEDAAAADCQTNVRGHDGQNRAAENREGGTQEGSEE